MDKINFGFFKVEIKEYPYDRLAKLLKRYEKTPAGFPNFIRMLKNEMKLRKIALILKRKK